MVIDKNSDAVLEVSDQVEYMNMLKNASITEYARRNGVDIDVAVQLRIDEAVCDTYDKIAARQGVIAQDIYKKWAEEHCQEQPTLEVTVRPIESQRNLYGYASVKIGGIKIDDFKILADKDGYLFLGMPSKPDKTSTTGYRSTVFIDKDYRDDFKNVVLSAYFEAVKQMSEKTGKITTNKPERMTEQMATATKEVAEHNATLPAPEKKAEEAER